VYTGRLEARPTPCILIFTSESILITAKEQTVKTISYKDLIGFNDKQIDDRVHTIQLNSYPKIKKLFRSEKRYLETFQIWVKMDEEEYERLKVLLLRVITNRPIKVSQTPLKLLIYLNPMAGSNSRKHF
jgi:hypothetical protein